MQALDPALLQQEKDKAEATVNPASLHLESVQLEIAWAIVDVFRHDDVFCTYAEGAVGATAARRERKGTASVFVSSKMPEHAASHES